MADVQLENGYVKIANELLDAVIRLRLTGYQTSIFFSIIRKTYGFNKREDQISLSQFEEMAGIARRNVYRTVQELQSMNLITIRKESHMRVFYGVQKDVDKWSTVVKPEINCCQTRQQNCCQTRQQQKT
jgi:phage replication O-like protein O